MTTEDALKQLEPFTCNVPKEILTTIRETWPAAEPTLLAELDWQIEHPYAEDRSALFLYALFLCAEMHSKTAFDRYLALSRLPEKMHYHILGDILTESMPHFLSNTCHGRVDELKALLEDRTVDEFSRANGLYALLNLTREENFPRAEMEQYCIDLLSEKLEHHPNYMWDTVITISDNLHLRKALPLIKAAYDKGWADPFMESFESVEASLNRPEGTERKQEEEDLEDRLGSTEENMSFYSHEWPEDGPLPPPDHSYLLETPAKDRRKQPRKKEGKVPGRNEPCPCGSGKKYKKCCIEIGFVRDETSQADPFAGPKNKTDEWIMAGNFYKTINPRNALICWSQAWLEVLEALPESATDPDAEACNELFNGFDFLSNWIQDVEILVDDLAAESIAAVRLGMVFYPAVLKRFPNMNPVIRRNFECSLAQLECICGKTDIAMARLQQMIETHPLNAQGYAVLAALLSFDAKRFNIPTDIPAAQHLLLQAKMRANNCADWKVDSRLNELSALASTLR